MPVLELYHIIIIAQISFFNIHVAPPSNSVLNDIVSDRLHMKMVLFYQNQF